MRKLYKSLIAPLYDHSINLQERMFRLMSILGLCALIIMSVLSFLINESTGDVLTILGGLSVFTVILTVTLKSHRIQMGASVISTILIFIMLPMVFFESGGMYGGTPMWFLFSAVFVCLVVRGKARIAFLIGDGLVLTACYAIQWYKPVWIVPHTAKMAYTDSLASTIIVGLFISLMVVFESKLYVEEQRIAEEQRKQIEEINRAQNRFFSNMSHEIRTPVNTIIGLNEIIMREAVTSEVAEDARNIQGAGNMLLALINDILDMSRIESGKMELVPAQYNIGELLSEITSMIWSRAKDKGLEFKVEADETTPAGLIGDDVRIKQILINLLNNAVKYTAEGAVTLTVECRRQQFTDNKKVDMVFTIADTGIGIRKESLPMLFDVFRRVDESKNRYIEGTGLGLTIVKQLVDLMGGEITVDSVYTKGSTFRVVIPQRIADEKEIGKITFKSGMNTGAGNEYRQSFEAPGARILIVDDNDLNAQVASKLLAPSKIKIDTASSGSLCLEMTQNNRYDLIYMDHLMPELDGIETLQRMRVQKGGLNRQTPVVALTANAGADNQALYKRSGFDGYMLKPVTGAELEETTLAFLSQELVKMTGVATVKADDTRIVDKHIRKRSIAVSVDSDCDLPPELLAAHRISVMPYMIRTEDGLFVDGRDLSASEAAAYAAKNQGKPIIPIAPSVVDYEAFFAERLINAEHVFHISTSAGGSQTLKNAGEAAAAFDNVTVFDSVQFSGGIGMLAIYAARIADSESLTPAALLETMTGVRSRVRSLFVAENTLPLMKNGLIKPSVHSMCRSFLLRPVLSPREGGVAISGFVNGPRQQYLRQFITRSIRNADIDRSRLFVISTTPQPDEKEKILDLMKKHPYDDVQFYNAGAVTSLVWGMNALELVYLLK
ncbi:MAG: DegV family protein [Lachnospiraceae bacterium]|nr:DegV family protein [Lachnospiraceae bacterium]